MTPQVGDVYKREKIECNYPMVVIEQIVDGRIYFRKESKMLTQDSISHSLEVFIKRFNKVG